MFKTRIYDTPKLSQSQLLQIFFKMVTLIKLSTPKPTVKRRPAWTPANDLVLTLEVRIFFLRHQAALSIID